MIPSCGKVLLIGYGNPGRLDDGLGPALAGVVGRWGLERVTVERCYQLAVEHAEQVARHQVVIFADADVACPDPFRFESLEPRMDAAFTTHSMAPASVLGLARHVFGATTDGFLLGIRGYDFDAFGECLSPRARANLDAAAQFLESALQTSPCEA